MKKLIVMSIMVAAVNVFAGEWFPAASSHPGEPVNVHVMRGGTAVQICAPRVQRRYCRRHNAGIVGAVFGAVYGESCRYDCPQTIVMETMPVLVAASSQFFYQEANESKGENKMSNQFEFEPAYYLASATQYVSDDGRHYIVGPIWECVKQIDGEQHFPVVVARKGMEGCVYWCREKSRGSSGNFEMESQDGDFRLTDNSFCHSDETDLLMYAEFASDGATSQVALKKLAR